MMQGDRVMLRPMEKTDTDDVLRMRSNPEVLAQLFSDEPPTRESHRRWLEQIQAQGVRQEFMIVERATGRSIHLLRSIPIISFLFSSNDDLYGPFFEDT